MHTNRRETWSISIFKGVPVYFTTSSVASQACIELTQREILISIAFNVRYTVLNCALGPSEMKRCSVRWKLYLHFCLCACASKITAHVCACVCERVDNSVCRSDFWASIFCIPSTLQYLLQDIQWKLFDPYFIVTASEWMRVFNEFEC